MNNMLHDIEDPAIHNGYHPRPEATAGDHTGRSRARAGAQDQTIRATTDGNRNGAPSGEVEIHAPVYTDAHLQKMIPPEPVVPPEAEVKEQGNDLIQQQPERSAEIARGMATDRLKLRPNVKRGAEERQKLLARMTADRDECREKWPPLARTLRTCKKQIQDALDLLAERITGFRDTLSRGGFDPDVTPDIQGTEETIRRRVQQALAHGDTAFLSIVEPVTHMAPRPGYGTEDAPFPTPDDLDLSPAEDELPGVSSAAVVSEMPTEPVKPTPIPAPEKPAQHVRKRFDFASGQEMLISVILSLIIGAIFGGALANRIGLVSVRDLQEFRSASGNFCMLVLGPVLLLLVGEGYKQVTKEAVMLGHPQGTRNRYSTFALWALLLVLFAFSLADISATANLFRQAALDNPSDIWGKEEVAPLWMFWLQGLLISCPLVVYKVILGRKSGLQECHLWERYHDEVERVESANRLAQTDYDAEWQRYEAKLAQRQREVEAAEQKQRELHELRKMKAQATEQKLQELREHQVRQVKRRHEEEQRINTICASIRQSNKAIQDAHDQVDEISKVENELVRLRAEEQEVGAQLSALEARIAPTTAELRHLAEIDLTTMHIMNDVYRGLCGEEYFGADAVRAVTAVLNTPVPPAATDAAHSH